MDNNQAPQPVKQEQQDLASRIITAIILVIAVLVVIFTAFAFYVMWTI
jgi:hypothetical protein